MRPIDADALIISECGQCDGACHCFDGQKCLECNSHNKCQLREAIDYADIIDVAPVVLCGNCKFYESAFSHCQKFGVYKNCNFICAYGEVKDDASNLT